MGGNGNGSRATGNEQLVATCRALIFASEQLPAGSPDRMRAEARLGRHVPALLTEIETLTIVGQSLQHVVGVGDRALDAANRLQEAALAAAAVLVTVDPQPTVDEYRAAERRLTKALSAYAEVVATIRLRTEPRKTPDR